MNKVANTITYEYQILRYRHDVGTGEFANIGLVYFDPQTRFLRAHMVKSVKRLEQFFGKVQEEHLLNLLTFVEQAFNDLGEQLQSGTSVKKYKSVEKVTSSILPTSDNALFFSEPHKGFEFDHNHSFADIYNRTIGRYYNECIEGENIEKKKKAIKHFLELSPTYF
jgi:hypothetical protein